MSKIEIFNIIFINKIIVFLAIYKIFNSFANINNTNITSTLLNFYLNRILLKKKFIIKYQC